MFKKLFSVWVMEDLLKQALKESGEMLNETRQLFQAVLKALTEKEEIDFDIYGEDRIINRYEINIRRKVLEHLSVSPRQDLTASLVLTSIIIDIERIGDFSKNIYELARMFPEKFSGDYFSRLKEISGTVLELFEHTCAAFSDADVKRAKIVTETHWKIAKECDRIIADLLMDEKIAARRAVVAALCSRYLKRVSAHLMNISSSVVNPFDRIGFRTAD
ncbi:MAG TPA: hypothetical protein EYP53_10255 [Candidatus Latescibacteria bacterium]|nr:hypothetical protein [Candidatus Latescibacterota bacterium]